VEQLVVEARTSIQEKDMTNDEYLSIWKQLTIGSDNIGKHFQLNNEILCGKNKLYTPKEIHSRVMASEHNSKVLQHFGREQSLELILRDFYWPIIESIIQKYCNKCDNCQQRKSAQHAKHGMLHP
jgi:hypothetical protein